MADLSSTRVFGKITVMHDALIKGNIDVTDLTADSITETSSEILKKDIVSITDALNKVTQLNGVEYTRISTDEREAGLIAEQVEGILPDVVSDQGNYKTISYSRLTAYLIEAIKTLKQEVDELKKNGDA